MHPVVAVIRTNAVHVTSIATTLPGNARGPVNVGGNRDAIKFYFRRAEMQCRSDPHCPYALFTQTSFIVKDVIHNTSDIFLRQ